MLINTSLNGKGEPIIETFENLIRFLEYKPTVSYAVLNGKKMISVSIGCKDESLYSVDASLTSLNSFAEAAGMKIILEEKFYNCLKPKDILEQEEKINNFIISIKEKIKN